MSSLNVNMEVYRFIFLLVNVLVSSEDNTRNGVRSDVKAPKGANSSGNTSLAKQNDGPSKPGSCPSSKGMWGICLSMCWNDNSCKGTQRCCSNGCGHTCMEPVYDPPEIAPLQNRDVIASSPLTVQCTTTPGNPAQTSYRWTRSTDSWSQTGQTLRLPSVTKGDAADYTCTAWNVMTPTGGSPEDGTDTETFTVNVLYPPEITPLQNRAVIASTTLNVTCTTTPGNPSQTSYRWTRSTDSWSQTGQTLRLPSATKGDAADYTCTAWNVMTPTGGSAVDGTDTETFTVNVLYPPVIKSIENKESVALSPLTVQCTTTPGNPAQTSYRWTRSTDNIWSQDGQSLRLPSVTKGDAANYTCTAWNVMTPTGGSPVDGTDTETFTVNVMYKASVTSFKLSEETGNTPSYTVNENDIRTFQCNVDSNPAAKITIRKPDGSQLVDKNNAYEVSHARTLGCLDAGNYTCSGSNPYNGNDKSSMDLGLFVRCPPRAHDSVNNYTYYRARNESVTLNLTFTAYPPPTSLQWFKQLPDASWENIRTGISSDQQQSNLTVQLLTQDDFGQYKIEVVNDLGKLNHLSYVTEHGLPSVPRRFRMVGSLNKTIFIWKSGNNGGYQQTFIIEVSPVLQTRWTEKLSVNEWDEYHRFQNGFFIADINGLDPGSYKARVSSSNKLGKSEASELPLPFVVSQRMEPSSESLQGAYVSAGAVAGGVIAGIEAVVIVAVVFYAMRLRRRNLANKDGSNDGKCVSKLHHQQTTQERNETYDNIAAPSASSREISDAPRNVYEQLNPGLGKERVYSAVEPPNDEGRLDVGAEYINLNV